MFKSVLIHYFSGTGNTAHVVKIMEQILINNQKNVSILNIESEYVFALDDYDLHIVLFPVYGFGVPNIMLHHIRSFNDVLGIKAAIISVGGHTGKIGGDEGNSLSHAYKILIHRGFDVFLTKLVSYPENFTQLINPPSEEDVENIFKVSDKEVFKIVDIILREKKDLKKRYILLIVLFKLIDVYFFLYLEEEY